MSWLAAFLLTQAIEVPIYARPLRFRLLAAFGASLLTHPFVYLALPRLWPGSAAGYVIAAEGIAIGVEGLYLRALGVERPWQVALLANGASVGVSLLF